MRIGVAGILGRMGRLVAEQVEAAGATLVGGTALPGGAVPARGRLFASIDDLARASDVVVDFTHPSAIAGHAIAMGNAGAAWVVGTTGLSDAETALVGRAATLVTVVHAANFSAGVTLLVALAEQLARRLPAEAYDAEIIEMHHRQKLDAPSGTALALGRAVAAGRGVDFGLAADRGRDGQTGPRRTGAIGFSAIRGGQVVGDHTLLFAGAAEQIEITHRAFDRGAFATGAVRAALWTAGRPPGLYSMRDVLGLEGAAALGAAS